MLDVVRIDDQILGGVPCFAGTRVPVRSLFDHLKLGYTVERFLQQFPTVKQEQVVAVLNRASQLIHDDARRTGAPVKLLLDENLPHELRHHLPGHDVFTAAYMGWGGIRNGALLALAAQNGFDAMITIDAGIEFEQNLAQLPCSVVILQAESNAFEHIQPLIPSLLDALVALAPRSLVRVG